MKKFFGSTQFLVNGLLVIGGFVMLVGGWLLGQIFGSHYPEKYLNILMAIADLFIIASCVFVIIRREMPRPGLSSTRGTIAVVGGILGLSFFGGLEILFIYYLFKP
jgi:hypothetical protein